MPEVETISFGHWTQKAPIYSGYRAPQLIMKTIISLVLLLELALSAELCTSDVYDSYLEAYPMKCGNACDEYKM